MCRVGAWPSVAARPLCLWRVPDPLPRAYLVDHARSAVGLAAVRAVVDPGFDPRREILVDERESERAGATDFAGAARMHTKTVEEMEKDRRGAPRGKRV